MASEALAPDPGAWDPRVREAVRRLENEIPTPANVDIAAGLGLSEFYFTRLFTAQVGRSPHDYAIDYKLRHAAGRLRYTDDPIEDLAKDFGYASQATFTRAFAARFGDPPARWRRRAQAGLERVEGAGEVRLEPFRPVTCLARRYLGPRSLASAQWADFLERLPSELRSRPRLGLAYDDPRITAPERIRYDCAVAVPRGFASTEALAADGFERLTTPDGLWACADVTGRAGTAGGYARILQGWLPQNREWSLEGDPFLERFRHTPEDPVHEPALTVCLRVRRSAAPSAPGMAAGA